MKNPGLKQWQQRRIDYLCAAGRFDQLTREIAAGQLPRAALAQLAAIVTPREDLTIQQVNNLTEPLKARACLGQHFALHGRAILLDIFSARVTPAEAARLNAISRGGF